MIIQQMIIFKRLISVLAFFLKLGSIWSTGFRLKFLNSHGLANWIFLEKGGYNVWFLLYKLLTFCVNMAFISSVTYIAIEYKEQY